MESSQPGRMLVVANGIDMEVDGDRATVTFSHPTYRRDPADDLFSLVYVDGRWLVDSFPDDRDDDDIPPWAFPS